MVGAAPGAEVLAEAVGPAPGAEVVAEAGASGSSAASTIVATTGAEEEAEVSASGSSSRSAIVVSPGTEEVDASGSGAVSALVATADAEPDALGTSVLSGDGVVLDVVPEAGLVSVGVEATVLNQGRGLDHADVDGDEPSVDNLYGANVDVGSAAVCHPCSRDGLRETCWDTPTELQGWETPAEFRARSPLPLWCARAK
jgi:hypothetical protein